MLKSYSGLQFLMWFDPCLSDYKSYYCDSCLFYPGHICLLMVLQTYFSLGAFPWCIPFSWIPFPQTSFWITSSCLSCFHINCAFAKGLIMTTLFKIAIYPPLLHSTSSFLSLLLFHSITFYIFHIICLLNYMHYILSLSSLECKNCKAGISSYHLQCRIFNT
jgi:hypothetical protein